MSCREFTDLLLDVLGGSLPRRRAVAARRHLASCPDCAAYARQYRATVEIVRAMARQPIADTPCRARGHGAGAAVH